MDRAYAVARVALRQCNRAGQRQLPQISLNTTISGAGRLPTALSLALRPDLNPIEKLWANFKRRWRQTGESLEELIAKSDY